MSTRVPPTCTIALPLLALAACSGPARVHPGPTAEIESAHAKVVIAFNTCDRAAFLAAYAERFSFTTSNTRSAYTTADALASYLGAACAQSPSPQITVTSQSLRLAGGLAVLTGQYSFRLVNQGTARDIRQNFTAVFQREADAWRVMAHHVSLAP